VRAVVVDVIVVDVVIEEVIIEKGNFVNAAAADEGSFTGTGGARI
jgi:hypothetical protein